MNTGDMFDDFTIEREIKEKFGVPIDVDKAIVRDIAVGQSAKATVFLSRKKHLYCYIYGPAKLLLSDVKKIVARIGLKAEMYIPPKGRPRYFDEVGEAKFKEVYPGRKDIHDSDLVFYRTLAPYTPALILVEEVRDGTLYQADHDARGGWRPTAKFTYRRIKTS
ncbi:hypothetical protein KC967_01280 [Candidatus Saccharibacteria bacterium]|nr:hypothetical protein [Candidatus Saccharibacteria bacterium]